MLTSNVWNNEQAPSCHVLARRAVRRYARFAIPCVEIARGLACFLGGFILLNLLGEWHQPGWQGNLWWIDLILLPLPMARLLLAAAGLCLLYFGSGRRYTPAWRLAGLLLLLALFAATLANTEGVLALTASGAVHSSAPIPLSALVAVLLLVIMGGWWAGGRGTTRRQNRQVIVCAVLACLAGFPLAQIACFGRTDYRRPAQAIVVFGTHTYADGQPSLTLADRVRTACDLYHAGLAPLLIFSGGPGDGAISEPEAMRHMAIDSGVPASAILLDRAGRSTRATVENSTAIFRCRGIHRVMAVSQYYHLPRIKVAYRSAGWDVFTVPAYDPLPLSGRLFSTLREVPAFWVYYLRGMAG